MKRKEIILIAFLGAIILIATAQGARPTFKGDPAACAWYNDTSIGNPLDDYYGLFDPRAHPDWRGPRIYDQINVFARANNDSLLWYHLTPINSERFGTVSTVLPGTLRIDSSPAVVQRGPNTIDVFALESRFPGMPDPPKRVHHLRWDGRSWFDNVIFTDTHSDEVAVSSWGPDRLDIFVYSDSGRNLWHMFWDRGNWNYDQIEDLGAPPGGINSAAAAGSWGPNHIDVVVKGEGDRYYRKSYDIGGWGEWQPLWGIFTSRPSITPTPPFPGGGGERKINIFGRGQGMGLHAKGIRSDGTATSWGNYGGGLNSAPAAINYIGDHFTVFARGIDNTLWWLDWDVGIWNYCDLGEEHFRWEPVPDLPIETRGAGAAGPIVTEERDSIIQMVNDTTIPGSDYRDFDLKTADPKLCGQACIDDPTCVACTYVKPGYQGPNARCWLKNNVAAQVPDDCCLSGVKEIRAAISQAAPAQPVSMINSTDRPGSDYTNLELATADPNLCAQMCTAEPQCRACTYVKPGYQGSYAKCYLKNSVPAEVPAECCISGVKEEG